MIEVVSALACVDLAENANSVEGILEEDLRANQDRPSSHILTEKMPIIRGKEACASFVEAKSDIDAEQDLREVPTVSQTSQKKESVDMSRVSNARQELGLGGKLSALLFSSPRPLSIKALCSAVGCDTATVEKELRELSKVIDSTKFGFSLCEVSGSWQFRTSPLAASVITRLAPAKGRRLTQAISETLAVIAYKQPVCKSEIDGMRGVDSLPSLRTLLDLGLVAVLGKSDAPGQPPLYGTTSQFLERFGLNSPSELPPIGDISNEIIPVETE